MKIEAYAKVNFIMNIIGKMPDGYHEVETVMQAVEPHDDVYVTTKEGFGVLLSIDNSKLCNVRNIAYIAAETMLAEFNRKEEVQIKIVKRIPIAAGLGGGSADAAAVITALAKLWEIDDFERLLKIGGRLGTDIPFCIAACFGHKAAIGRGRGDQLEFIEPVDCKLQIERLDYHIPEKTKSVYKELKPEDYKEPYDIKAFLAAKTIAEKEKYMGNHLQAPAFRLFEAAGYTLPKEKVHLSGAGPAIFKIIE